MPRATLNAEDKKLLEKIDEVFKAHKFNDDTDESNIDLKSLNKIHTSINKLSEMGFAVDFVFELNMIMHNYKGDNLTVKLLRKLTYLRNKMLINDACNQNELWEAVITGLQTQIQKLFDVKIKKKLVIKAFIELLRTYVNNWLGPWTIIKTKEHPFSIVKIDVFDKDDYDKIITFITNEVGWKMKDTTDMARLKTVKPTKPTK
jgi:hypothetical protein